MLHEALSTANQLAQAVPWDAAVYAPVVVVVLAIIKKVKAIDNGEVMIWLLGIVSGASAIVHYLITANPGEPHIIAASAIVTYIATQPVYYVLLKPALAFFASEVQKAAILNEVKTANVPSVQEL